jgi:hypothetical protein
LLLQWVYKVVMLVLIAHRLMELWAEYRTSLCLMCVTVAHLGSRRWPLGGDSFGIGRHFHCQILALQRPWRGLLYAHRVGCYAITGSHAGGLALYFSKQQNGSDSLWKRLIACFHLSHSKHRPVLPFA